ncbi:hypothetical protein DH2020_029011 [Rehmannia glutinosa]|uniref:Anaphase-promoting complex subunit 4-like WD40 domain-containing protein n=1 Tax=Rehmannia glutinosa TaxID=99300 RepID=A0ABR0VPS7_REHGL
MDFDYAHYMLTGGRVEKEDVGPCSPSKQLYRKHLAEILNMNRTRILAFKNKAPTLAKDIHESFSPSSPERTLDAPDIVDDFYLNLLDWGSGNVIAIALGNSVYLWDASDGSISELLSTDDDDIGPVTSVKWAPDGKHLAVGFNNSDVQLWDSSPIRLLRTLRGGHQLRVVSLDWNDHILTTGGMDGLIINNDSNLLASGGGIGDQCIKFWNTNTGACLNSVNTGSQVCALLWSTHERELLSAHGFNDNQLTLWKYPSMVKIVELFGHTSRVLSMTKSPDGHNVASIAGDETLRFWNVFGTPLEKPGIERKQEPFPNVPRIR